MSKREILISIAKGDWERLLSYLTEEEIKQNFIETNLDCYELEGDYETDARYTYPCREQLIKTVIKKMLKEASEQRRK